MRITSKGQVTIPQRIRQQLGLLPHTEVEFELAGDHARIRKAQRPAGESLRGRLVLEALRGSGDVRMTTDQIMALTSGEPRPFLAPCRPRVDSGQSASSCNFATAFCLISVH
jgi:AbrB family looped-hinge helix DNA binding protein